MYKVEQNKQIIITDSKNKKHKFIVPLDFEVNNESIDKLINSDKDLLRCEEWLIMNGFEKEERGWSIYSDTKRTIRIPQFFINFEKKDLRVKFHKIVGIKNFIIPYIKIGNRGATFFFNYSTMNNFPDYINTIFSVSFRSLTGYEQDFMREMTGTKFFLDNPEYTIDNKFFLEMLKSKNGEALKEYDQSRFDIEFFKKYPDLYNQIKSYQAVNKFNL